MVDVNPETLSLVRNAVDSLAYAFLRRDLHAMRCAALRLLNALDNLRELEGKHETDTTS